MGVSDDEVSQAVLLIKSSSARTSSLETFLRNRDWYVFASSSLKEALAFLVEHKPLFVMIPVDHPVRKIQVLPKILTQAFPVCVISYVEQPTAPSYRLLTEAPGVYKIKYPATGPAVMRTIQRYFQDQEKAESEAAAVRDESEKLNSTVDEGRPIKPLRRSQGSGNRSSENSSASDFDGPQALDKNVDDNSLGDYPEKHHRLTPGPETDSEERDEHSEELSEQRLKARKIGPFKKTRKTGDEDSGDPVEFDDAAGEYPESTESTDESPGLTARAEAGPKKLRGLKGLSKHGSWEPIDPKLISEDGEDNEAQLQHEQEKERHGAREIPKFGPTSAFEAGAQAALEESVQKGDGTIKESVKVATNVACIAVESNRFSGYLVAAMGQNRKMDASFVESIREKLTKFLIQQGDIVTKDDQMNLTIKPVDFQAWALDYAEFLRKSVHNGDEVAMAFFPKKIEKTEVGESASAEMATIRLEDVVVGVPLEFNLYIYMPVNQKYILYTPKGAKLYQEQKQRLTTQGHNNMHMLKAEVPELDRFKAQNHLNDIIDQHQNKAKRPA